VLGRRARGIAARPEMLERVHARRRLPEYQGQQGEEGDQWSAGCMQETCLDNAVIL
jgi:hypothetical protein